LFVPIPCSCPCFGVKGGYYGHPSTRPALPVWIPGRACLHRERLERLSVDRPGAADIDRLGDLRRAGSGTWAHCGTHCVLRRLAAWLADPGAPKAA